MDKGLDFRVEPSLYKIVLSSPPPRLNKDTYIIKDSFVCPHKKLIFSPQSTHLYRH